jgi:hypothetical protein
LKLEFAIWPRSSPKLRTSGVGLKLPEVTALATGVSYGLAAST